MFDFSKLDQLKTKLDSYRPLPKAALKNIHEDLVLRWTYNSNAIEGNTLTLKETKVALEGITVGGKTMQEHFEAINHREAIYFVEQLAQSEDPLTEWQMRAIHQLILKNIDDDNAGKYRTANVIITGAKHVPPDVSQVSGDMNNLAAWLANEAKAMHPVESS